MDLSAVGAASIQMSMAKTQQSVGLALTKMMMDSQEVQATQLIEDLAEAVPVPSFGHQLDILA